MKQEVELICCDIHQLKVYLLEFINDGYIIDSVSSRNELDWIIIIHIDENTICKKASTE